MLNLNHKRLAVYKASCTLIRECYYKSSLLPPDEKFGLTQQIRRAALSVKLNLAEGCSRRSEAERRRFFEISRGSVIEIDAAFETVLDLEYLEAESIESLRSPLNTCFALLSKMMQ